jgi:hypothetical protein
MSDDKLHRALDILKDIISDPFRYEDHDGENDRVNCNFCGNLLRARIRYSDEWETFDHESSCPIVRTIKLLENN